MDYVAAEHLDFPFNFLKLQTQYGTEIHNFRLSQIRLRCMDNVAESDNYVDPRTTYHKLIHNKVTIRNRKYTILGYLRYNASYVWIRQKAIIDPHNMQQTM